MIRPEQGLDCVDRPRGLRDADGSDSIIELNGNSVEQEEVRILRCKRQLIPSTRRGIHLRWSAAAAAQVRRVEVHEPSPPLQRRNSVVAQAVEDLDRKSDV